MSMEDLTLRQISEAMEMMLPLSESIIKHALIVLGDPDHECDQSGFDEDEVPDFNDADLKAYLAYEESTLEMIKFMRQEFIKVGYTELTEEVVS